MPKTKAVDPDSPEWTKERTANALSFSELPASLQGKLKRGPGERGPQKAPTKAAISIRLSKDVLTALRANGRGWQTLADDALRKAFVR